jgi:PASTA domain
MTPLFVAATATLDTQTNNPVDKLPGITGPVVLWSILCLIAAGGIIMLFGRVGLSRGYWFKNPERTPVGSGQNRSSKDDENTSVVRSWVAIVLVGGLLILAAASFGLADETLRSTIIGGVVSASSAAVAFYFAGKAANEARRDLINAQTDRRIEVPKLQGKTIEVARNEASARGLFLAFEAGVSFSDADTVASTSPEAGTRVQSGAYILVRKQPPNPASHT